MDSKKYVFKFECSQSWDNLTATGDEKVRHCRKCDTNVYSVSNPAEFNAHAEKGHCVYSPMLRTAGIPVSSPENIKVKLSDTKKWWQFWK